MTTKYQINTKTFQDGLRKNLQKINFGNYENRQRGYVWMPPDIRLVSMSYENHYQGTKYVKYNTKYQTMIIEKRPFNNKNRMPKYLFTNSE